MDPLSRSSWLSQSPEVTSAVIMKLWSIVQTLTYEVALSGWIDFAFTRMTNQVSWVRIQDFSLTDQLLTNCYIEIPSCLPDILRHLLGHRDVPVA